MGNENVDWEDVESGAWEPENDGDIITGVVVRREPRQNDISPKYYIVTKDDGELLVWGKSKLDRLMSNVEDGELIRITYLGEVKNKSGRKMHDYQVQRQKKPSVSEVQIEAD